MSTDNIEVSIGPLSGPPSLRHHLMDFANMLKAFIGSNYLTIAFAFRQSGVHLGWIGLIAIATLTAHCCRLIVKCKYHSIDHILLKAKVSSTTQETNAREQRHSADSSVTYTSSESSCDEGSGDQKTLYKKTLYKKLQRNMTFGDIGRICMGKTGLALVNVSIMITQFGFCVGYFIFIGNTINSMFPLYNCSVAVTNSSDFIPTLSQSSNHCVVVTHLNSLNAVHVDMSDMLETEPGVLHNKRMLPFLDEQNSPTTEASVDSLMDFLVSGNNISTVHVTERVPSDGTSSAAAENTTHALNIVTTQTGTNVTTAFMNATTAETNISTTSASPGNTTEANTTTTAPTPDTTTIIDFTTTIFLNTTSLPWTNMTKWILTRGKHVPDLKLLVLTPLAFFVIMVLIRHLRHLGFISAIANFSIFVGCIEVLVFLIVGFEVSSTFKWINIYDMPIFFGMVTSAFEGIGTILPIEASMEGNRHNFVKFLYGAIAILAMILGAFGVMGYLRFGDDVEQMINANIPNGAWLSIAVNVCLCIGVLLTFPLMLFPVVELAELYLFGRGRLCGPQPEEDKSSDHQSLLPKNETELFIPVAEKISDSVPTWKRNALRIFIVLTAAGLAVLLRNNFAYISAFVGALGSTMLAYILPCLFHLRLCWQDLPVFIRVKDIIIIILGIACGVAGIYSVLQEIISSGNT
ncbi:uncharacterized protein [Littorina saxatilis]|uniref:uncharacterized protein n=1 Tax=Littorina saxatilis TaxID=31220 RepID=UPI0038B5E6AE